MLLYSPLKTFAYGAFVTFVTSFTPCHVPFTTVACAALPMGLQNNDLSERKQQARCLLIVRQTIAEDTSCNYPY